MVQELPKEGPDSWSPEGKVGDGVSICFMCKDAIAIYRHMVERGFEVSKPLVGNRLWVTSLSDAEGIARGGRASSMSLPQSQTHLPDPSQGRPSEIVNDSVLIVQEVARELKCSKAH